MFLDRCSLNMLVRFHSEHGNYIKKGLIYIKFLDNNWHDNGFEIIVF